MFNNKTSMDGLNNNFDTEICELVYKSKSTIQRTVLVDKN